MDASWARNASTWYIRRRKSFAFAFNGLRRLYREPNARLHAIASVIVVGLGVLARLPAQEWALLILAATVVWVAEAFNTALEVLADAAISERHPLVGTAKDVAASAVLLAAFGAAGVGVAVLVPRLWSIV